MPQTESIDSLPESDQGASAGKDVTHRISAFDLIRHGAQAVAAAGSRPAYEHKLRGDMLTRPSIALHGDNIAKLDGFDVHGTAAAPAVDAMNAVHAAVASIIDARGKSERDPELIHSEASQVLRVADYADKQIDAAAKRCDAANKSLQSQIDAAEGELRRGIAASNTALATEIRAHAKAHKSPVSFVGELIAAGDEAGVTAILGAPPYLSGLTAQMRDALTHQWNSRKQPQLTQKLTLLRAAQERLERAGTMLFTQAERAMGVDYRVIQRLREAKRASAF